MDVREKLVELANDVLRYLPWGEIQKDTAERIADRMMDHGATVQEFGRWNIIMDDYDCEMMQCSVCKTEFYDGDNDTVDCMHNYCPHCGAKMLPQPPKGE